MPKGREEGGGEWHTREIVDVVKSLGNCMFSWPVKLRPSYMMNQYTKFLPVNGTYRELKRDLSSAVAGLRSSKLLANSLADWAC